MGRAVTKLGLKAILCRSTMDMGEGLPRPWQIDADESLRRNVEDFDNWHGKAGGRIRVGARRQDGLIEFYVQDFGPGIAPEHLPRLTERFYRVDVGDSRAQGGTGRGLSLVKHIVETVHKGRMFVESNVGKGSCFGFELRLAD